MGTPRIRVFALIFLQTRLIDKVLLLVQITDIEWEIASLTKLVALAYAPAHAPGRAKAGKWDSAPR